MACFYPIEAFRSASGEVVFAERGDIVQSLLLACGRCIGCRLERSRQWSVRIMHEAQLHDESCFVTLTYDEDHVPARGSLDYSDFQGFMKRLRSDLGKVRFFMCGEYGGEGDRPHFHCGLFGTAFRGDRYAWRKGGAGHQLYRSSRLEKHWPFGACEIGELTSESAAYMARYTFKKVTGQMADDHYRRVDPDTGEVYYLEPEFAHMSLKPGIGAGWFERFHSEVYPHDRVVVRGRESRPPRYYDVLLKRRDAGLLDQVQQSRILGAVDKWPNNTPARLAVREQVAQARAAFYKRKLK